MLGAHFLSILGCIPRHRHDDGRQDMIYSGRHKGLCWFINFLPRSASDLRETLCRALIEVEGFVSPLANGVVLGGVLLLSSSSEPQLMDGVSWG